MAQSKKILWYNLAFMAFSTVWGFGNVVNGFAYFNGVQVIFSWVLMFALYFVPYALMVGELGSAFKEAGGGVSSWIHETINPKIAYYAGWTYWVVHMPYISQKPQGALNALSWVVFQNGDYFKGLDTTVLQFACLAVFLFFAWVASLGLNPLKNMATLAGSSMFIMSILYIILALAAPAITGGQGMFSVDWSFDNLIPTFDWKYFSSLSILVFAVGGCEKISPYVNKVENPSKGFPKGMIALAIMVTVCAILGTVAMGMMFDPSQVSNPDWIASFKVTGSYDAFQKLGEYYGVGNVFVVIYSICNTIGQLSTLVISIDAPLRMLLDNKDARTYIPDGLLKKNKHDVYVNGIWLVIVIVSILILVPAIGIKDVSSMVNALTKLNSVCMPLRYLWVFAAYIALRKHKDKYHADYKFTKNQGMAYFFGFWCFAVTAFCCILGMYSEDTFQLALNVITPFVLVGLGAIMPVLAKKNKNVETAE